MNSEDQKFPALSSENVVHIGAGKDTLAKLPKAPAYLSPEAVIHYKRMGRYLIKVDRLKETYLAALEIYANAAAQYQWASEEINRKNGQKPGSGFMQVFASQATNISTEITLRNNAEKILFQCFKQFGLDPKSDKELKGVGSNPGQLDLFKQFLSATS
ncbi:MAG: P27 family phage terminase small subunit [Flavobacterium sp.]|nr:MAG: P27 family phage terminase small subunit [Flavobacterium sp.]